jgi:hypothetical protein
MSFNGSGTFVINSAGQPVVSGTVISSTAFNALTADLANGLSTCITKDGQTTPTADIPMGSNKITGLANGTAAGDAANLGQVQSTVAKLLGSVSGADTITAVGAPTVAAYAAGQMFYFVAAGANTGAVTINIDSLGAKNITRDGTTALAAGDIQSGEVCVIVYDGTQFQLVNGASQSASIVTENLTVNKATVLNESGGDNDTRIEGDTDANLFFVDASTDRIGVGTASPAYKLDVNGQARLGGTAGLFVGIGTAFSTGQAEAYTTSTTPMGIGTVGAAPLRFYTNSNFNAVLDSSGNLGLGVTPSAWDSNRKAFQIGGNGALWSQSSGSGFLFLSNNLYYDGTDFRYLNTAASGYYAIASDASFRWHQAASGTAGDPITFGDAKMTLDASGNLLVGTTTQYGSQKLSLNGGIAIDGRSAATPGLSEKSDDNTGIFWPAADTLGFSTNGTERARITAAGRFLVGSTIGTYPIFFSLPSDSGDWFARFHNTQSNSPHGLVIEYTAASPNGTGNDFFRCIDSTPVARMTVRSNGGIANYQANDVNLSDERVKTDIKPLGSMWDKFKAIEIVTFKYKDQTHDDDNIGVIAQQVESVAPEFIDNDGWGDKPTEDGVPAIKALQEAMTRIEQLEAKVAALEAK